MQKWLIICALLGIGVIVAIGIPSSSQIYRFRSSNEIRTIGASGRIKRTRPRV